MKDFQWFFFLTSCGTLYFQCFHAPIGSLFLLSTTSNWFFFVCFERKSFCLLFFFNRLPFYKRCVKFFRDALQMVTLHANLFISSSWCQLMTYLYHLLHDSQSVWLSLCCWSFTAATAQRERKSFSSAFLEKFKVCFSLFFPPILHPLVKPWRTTSKTPLREGVCKQAQTNLPIRRNSPATPSRLMAISSPRTVMPSQKQTTTRALGRRSRSFLSSLSKCFSPALL